MTIGASTAARVSVDACTIPTNAKATIATVSTSAKYTMILARTEAAELAPASRYRMTGGPPAPDPPRHAAACPAARDGRRQPRREAVAPAAGQQQHGSEDRTGDDALH